METTRLIHKLMVEKFGLLHADIRDNASFKQDYHIDSLDLFEFIIEVEKSFDITISEEQMEKIATPGQLIAYISSQQLDSSVKIES